MFHHIPALKFEPSPGANNPEEFLLYNVRIVHWCSHRFERSYLRGEPSCLFFGLKNQFYVAYPWKLKFIVQISFTFLFLLEAVCWTWIPSNPIFWWYSWVQLHYWKNDPFTKWITDEKRALECDNYGTNQIQQRTMINQVTDIEHDKRKTSAKLNAWHAV